MAATGPFDSSWHIHTALSASSALVFTSPSPLSSFSFLATPTSQSTASFSYAMVVDSSSSSSRIRLRDGGSCGVLAHSARMASRLYRGSKFSTRWTAKPVFTLATAAIFFRVAQVGPIVL